MTFAPLHRGRRLVVAASCFASLAILGVEPARGHDHTYPTAIAVAGEAQQVGRMGSVTWHSGTSDGHCGTLVGHGPMRFQKKAARFPAPQSIRLEFFKEQQPESVSVGVARKLRERGHNIVPGKRKYPEYRLEPITDDSGVVIAWAVILEAMRARHFYIDLRATWADVDGCGGSQSANWVFHLQGV